MSTTEQLLENLTKAVAYAYRKDGTSPGVLISNLKDGSVYASIVRYGKDFPKGKQVVCNANATTVPSALSSLSKKFLTQVVITKNPIDALKELVNGETKV